MRQPVACKRMKFIRLDARLAGLTRCCKRRCQLGSLKNRTCTVRAAHCILVHELLLINVGCKSAAGPAGCSRIVLAISCCSLLMLSAQQADIAAGSSCCCCCCLLAVPSMWWAQKG
jgi:hypothetical protein